MSVDAALVIADVIVGGILVAFSLGRWRSSSGALLAAGGGAWWLADLVPSMTFLHRGVLIHLVLSHPGGRSRGRLVLFAVAAGYVYAAVFPIARDDVSSLIMAAAVVAAAVQRNLGATVPGQRSTGFAMGAALCLGGALTVGPVSRISGFGAATAVLATYDVLIVTVAILVTIDMLWVGSARGALTGLVVDLGELTGSDVLRDRLAAVLGDPDLEMGYWLAERGEYTDDSGRSLQLPPPGDRRTITPLTVDGQPVAVLIHDSAVLGDQQLLAQVACVAQWAVGNIALRAQVRKRVEGVEASRRRIITAADAERERLERRLQQGAGQRLQTVAELVSCDGYGLAVLASDVERARSDINELAKGLHPRVLTERGLSAALCEVAEGSPVPVHLDVQPIRVSKETGATLYFACSEALTNVLKYAHPESVWVRLTADQELVRLVIADDGVGGADSHRGTGLRGLADRVEALGGRLGVDSPVGGGTRLEVSLPLYPQQRRAATLTQ